MMIDDVECRIIPCFWVASIINYQSCNRQSSLKKRVIDER